MERYFVLDKYNTWCDWRLILTEKEITPPEPKTNYVNIDGMNGTLDLSESLTGEVTYNDRVIKATFWTNEGNRKDRERLFRDILIALHGKKIKVIEPDDPTHYFIGRVIVKSVSNILPYLQFTIEITCEPWRYSLEVSSRSVSVSSSPVDIVINNTGAKTVCPDIEVTSSDNIDIFYDNVHSYLPTGTYKISNIKLRPGANIINVSGAGTVTFTYREADL